LALQLSVKSNIQMTQNNEIHKVDIGTPAEPRPGHPGQLAGLPRYRRGGRGEGGAYAGSPAGARRTEASAATGERREAEPLMPPPSLGGWDCPSVAEGPSAASASGEGTED
jgi:hypothetical protein